MATPSASSLDAYRDEADRFIAALDEEYYLHYAGLKESFELEPIYDDKSKRRRVAGSVEFAIVKVCFTRSFAFTITLNSVGSFRSRSGLCIYAPSFPHSLDHGGIVGAPVEIEARFGNGQRCRVPCKRCSCDL